MMNLNKFSVGRKSVRGKKASPRQFPIEQCVILILNISEKKSLQVLGQGLIVMKSRILNQRGTPEYTKENS